MAADPIRAALVGRLLATGSVTSKLGAANNVFHRVAPANAVPPYIVLHRQAGTDDWTFAGPALEHDLWTVKAICRGTSSTAADEIAAAVNATLNDAPIAVTGYALLLLRRVSKVDYGERADGESWHHVGGIFKVDVDPV